MYLGIAKLKIGQTNKEKTMEGVVVNNSPKVCLFHV